MFNLNDYRADMLSKLDNIKMTALDLSEADSDAKAFCYLIADMFETLEDGIFNYTDGANDLGIDFYVCTDGSYRIYQCKSIDAEATTGEKVFDSTPVNELDEAVSFMLGGERKASSKVMKLKNEYQLEKESSKLVATLAIDGTLSDSASDRFREISKKYSELGIGINLIDAKAIYEKWHSFDGLAKPKEVQIQIDALGDNIIKQRDWLCALINIRGLMKGMEKYRNGLFDLNVRSKLKKSNVNSSILKTISTRKGQERFIHLNNGLVISCTNYNVLQKANGVTPIKLKGAQVINGCQTLSTIWDYYYNASDEDKEALLDNLKIFVKVIGGPNLHGDLLDEIIVASNNQNPMNERNLKSNTLEQKRLQASFHSDALKPGLKYYYIRKDGEFESFLENETQGLKKKVFLIPDSTRRGANRYRHLDNEDLGKIWLSWIGNSSPVNSGSIKIFSDPSYSRIFAKRPLDVYWQTESNASFVFDSSQLEPPSPSPYQLLTAYGVSRYIQEKVKETSGRQLRQDAIERLISQKKLNEKHNKQEADAALSKDKKYLNAIWLSQMAFPLTEVAAFILLNKYGTLDSETCKRILDFEDVYYWLEHGTDNKFLNDEEMKDGLLPRLYSFITTTVDYYFMSNRESILMANRPKMLLGQRDTLQEIKGYCISIEDDYLNAPIKFKKIGETFLDSLPPLS